MILTAISKAAHRLLYGPLPEALPEDRAAGLVLIADGVGGFDLCTNSLRYAVGWSERPLAVRGHDWGHGFGRWHRDLTDTRNHAEQAAELARRVADDHAEHPDRPRFLVGKSGGSGIVVWALEQLPPDSVERAVLLAPALSPGYDLTQALRALRCELVVFWSPLDCVILGLGTTLFGTIDRRFGPSAGMLGFRCRDEAVGARLRQVRWHPRMAASAYFGGHLGPDHPRFLGRYVVPLLTTAAEPPA